MSPDFPSNVSVGDWATGGLSHLSAAGNWDLRVPPAAGNWGLRRRSSIILRVEAISCTCNVFARRCGREPSRVFP